MSAILGLIGTEQFSAQRFTSIRRSVFYQYPNGAAPLLGVTSLLKRQEEVSDPEFTWYEKRLKVKFTKTATAGGSPAGPWMTTGGAAQSDDFTMTTGTDIQLEVVSTEQFRVGHQIEVRAHPNNNGSATFNLQAVVSVVVNSTVLQITPIQTQTNVSNDADANALQVAIIGSAFAQGAVGSSVAPYFLPIALSNYCQIFRTSFSMTGTALKTGAKFDETGVYKDRAKDASVDHMIEMEFAFIFGKKSKQVDPITNLPTYTTGGILGYFLPQWEVLTTYNNAGPATLDSDDEKRIISNTAGTMNEDVYDGYIERLFRVTNNKANEKLCLCGSGFLKVLTSMYKGKSSIDAGYPQKDAYGMTVVKHVSPFGTVYYKTHPMFNQNPILRFNALFLDVGNLSYKYVIGRDTELLKNRQPNDADYRKDEWLSESGIALEFPESCLYLQNVTQYNP